MFEDVLTLIIFCSAIFSLAGCFVAVLYKIYLKFTQPADERVNMDEDEGRVDNIEVPKKITICVDSQLLETHLGPMIEVETTRENTIAIPGCGPIMAEATIQHQI